MPGRALANEALHRVIAQYSRAVDAWNIGDGVDKHFAPPGCRTTADQSRRSTPRRSRHGTA